MFTPDGLITILALLFVGMCFALATGAIALALILLAIAIIEVVAVYWLTRDDS